MKKIFLFNYYLLPFFLFLFFLFSCQEDRQQGKDETWISGDLQNVSSGFVKLEYIGPREVTPRDSAAIDSDGHFDFFIKVAEPGFYRVALSPDNFIMLLLDTSRNIHITADSKDLISSYHVSGSAGSALIMDLHKYLRAYQKKLDSLESIYQDHYSRANPNVSEVVRKLRSAYEIYTDNRDAYLRNFIEKNTTSLAALSALNNLDPGNNFPLYNRVADTLSKTMPNSPYVTELLARLPQLGRLAIGTDAPELTLSNPEGEQVSLSSYRGKIVLIDFWASWCRPCREENPRIVELYKKYHPKGFEIFGVSLDADKNHWVQAIKDDRLTWVHVSDLKQWQSIVTTVYDVQSIPFSVLVDRDGKIIGKGLSTPQLDKKLAEIFGDLSPGSASGEKGEM